MLLKRKKNIHTHAYIHLTCWLNNCNEKKKQKNPYKKRESLKTTFPKNLKVNKKKEKNNNSKSMILTDSLF